MTPERLKEIETKSVGSDSGFEPELIAEIRRLQALLAMVDGTRADVADLSHKELVSLVRVLLIRDRQEEQLRAQRTVLEAMTIEAEGRDD
jgi:hypothetical protein